MTTIFNPESLYNFATDNNIQLKGTYETVTEKTIITAICQHADCKEEVSKSCKSFYEKPYCKSCVIKSANAKRKATILKKKGPQKYGDPGIEYVLFNLAPTINGMDSNEWRKDPYGTHMKRSEYGEDTEFGWNIDHIDPQSNGGSDDIDNLQALNTRKNKSLGASKQKKSRHSKCNQ